MKPIIVVNFSEFTFQIVNVDSSKRLEDMYYKSEWGLTPIAYCYDAKHKEAIQGILDQMKAARDEFNDKQYKTQLFLRKEYGV